MLTAGADACGRGLRCSYGRLRTELRITGNSQLEDTTMHDPKIWESLNHLTDGESVTDAMLDMGGKVSDCDHRQDVARLLATLYCKATDKSELLQLLKYAYIQIRKAEHAVMAVREGDTDD